MHKVARIDIEKLKLNSTQDKMRPFDRYLEFFKIHVAEFDVDAFSHSQIIQEYSLDKKKGFFGLLKSKGNVLVFKGRAIGLIVELGKSVVNCTFTSHEDAYDFREYLLHAYVNADKKLYANIFEDESKVIKKKRLFSC